MTSPFFSALGPLGPTRFTAFGPRAWLVRWAVALILACRCAHADPLGDTTAYASGRFDEAKARFHREPANPDAAVQFGRACFELAECATNRTQRAEIDNQGIAACRQAVTRTSNSAPAHYYLGLNLGELARTEGFGALGLVSAMRKEFDLARSIDQGIDYAGPDRNLGQLYRDAPPLLSVGNRPEAERRLRSAVTLAPEFPDNHLELIEGFLKWGQLDNARRQLSALEAAWPAARAKLTGPAWAASWADWEAQTKQFKKKAQAP
jgi:tetratricopeptide (TPR) repeat protein